MEEINKILVPHPLESPAENYAVLAVSAVFEGFTWFVALREFRRGKGRSRWLDAVRSSKDPTVFTVLFEDMAALLGLLFAAAGLAVGQAFNLPVMDGVASAVIGVLLAVTAGFLAYESQSLLTGEGVQPDVRASIRVGVEGKSIPCETLAQDRQHSFGVDDVVERHQGDWLRGRLVSSV